MATTNTTKKENTKKVAPKKEEKVMTKKTTKKAKESISVIVPDDIKPMEEKVEAVVEEKKTTNNKKVNSTVKQMTNDEIRDLFISNGCSAGSKAKNESKVVYQQFGTKSRVLQQGRGYQLLLTNGHANTKQGIIATDNDDTARFIEWYDTLTDEQKGWVTGYADINNVRLSASEMPRERTVKLTNYDLLVSFIKYMGTFAENKLA